MKTVEVDVLIIGAGPSGLAAAIELRRLGLEKVRVVDREKQAGGVPRHCYHTGFGVWDMHRIMSGPGYAARYVRLAEQAGVILQTETAVTGWDDNRVLTATSPEGLCRFQAKAVVLATGCRERPRAARLVPGARPPGIFTTGMLQQYVYLHSQPVGKRAVVVGAEHVSFSAVLTLRHAGAAVAAMVTDLPRHQTYLPYKLLSADRFRVPIYRNARLTNIVGGKRVEAVELTDVLTGQTSMLECDTVVFTGNWIPDHELARLGGLVMDSGTNGPQIDLSLRTSVPGVFAVGNLVHSAETGDIAALTGRHVAGPLRDYLLTGKWREEPVLPIECGAPIAWVSPNAIQPGQTNAPHRHFILRVNEYRSFPTIEVWQVDRRLWRQRYRQVVPNLPVHLSDRWLGKVGPSGASIQLKLT